MSRFPNAIAVFSLLCLVSTGFISGCALLQGNASESSVTPEASTPASPEEPQTNTPDNRFDPRKIEPGDQLLGLEVVSVEANSVPNYGVTGKARFRGEVTVSGTYKSQEEGTPCFYVDEASASKLPRFQGDERIVWFCFNNPEEAKKAIGSVGTEGKKAAIVINDYETVYYPSDVYDTATLVRVVPE